LLARSPEKGIHILKAYALFNFIRYGKLIIVTFVPIMNISTKNIIIASTQQLFSIHGYQGFSMRKLESHSNIGLSSIYHFYENKDALLKDVYHVINHKLGEKRALLSSKKSASDMLMDRIVFQFLNMSDVIYVIKYYMHFRSTFPKIGDGYIPEKAHLHISEVLEAGIKNNEFNVKPSDLRSTSKTITHTINGYVLEYFPEQITGPDLKIVANSIHSFLLKSLTRLEVAPNTSRV
jgi:hypothetical protein